MQCVIGTFEYMEGLWKKRGEKMGDERLGYRAHAARERDRWSRWAGIARAELANVTGLNVLKL